MWPQRLICAVWVDYWIKLKRSFIFWQLLLSPIRRTTVAALFSKLECRIDKARRHSAAFFHRNPPSLLGAVPRPVLGLTLSIRRHRSSQSCRDTVVAFCGLELRKPGTQRMRMALMVANGCNTNRYMWRFIRERQLLHEQRNRRILLTLH